MKKIFTFENIKQFLINWVIALGIVLIFEIIASVTNIPLGVLIWFALVGFIYYGKKQVWW